MKIRFGIDGIVVEGLEEVPSTYELCKMDKRLLYIGNIRDSEGNLIHDAFIHVLNPTEIFTIEKTKEIEENTFLLKTEMHYFGKNSPILKYLYDNNSGEICVGDVCDGSGRTGEVWHDTYKMGLDSNILYTKNADGTHNIVVPPVENCFSVPDRFGFRIVVKTPNQPDQHYAFFYGISAFNQWARLKYYARDDQEVLHSLDPDYTKFLYYEEQMEFEKTPQLVKAYPKSYSNKGFLNLNK